MTPVHRSIVFSAVEKYGTLLLFVGSTAVLARLLSPAEFGVFAVINAIVAVISTSFLEFGGANYLIQKASLSEQNIRSCFTITLCISGLVGLVLLATTEVFVGFFHQEGLRAGIAVSTLNFLLIPFSSILTALLRRDLEFGKLAICNLVGTSTSIAVTVVLAVLNYSFMAPVWGAVAGSLAATILLLVFRKGLRIFLPSFAESSDVVKFGLYSGSVSIINVLYNVSPQIFMARIIDFAAVGLYSRAVSVTQVFDRLVGQVLGPVIMPAICAQANAGGNLKAIYLDAVALLTAIHWPVLAILAILAHPLLLVWLGPTWLEIVPLVRMICIGSLALFAACLTYPVLVAVGQVRVALIVSLITLPPSLLIIFMASFLGIEAVAASSMLTLPFQAAVSIYFISRYLDLRWSELVRATSRSAIVALACAIVTGVCAVLIEKGVVPPMAGLSLACVSVGSSWMLAMVVTHHPLLRRLQQAGFDLWTISALGFHNLAKRASVK